MSYKHFGFKDSYGLILKIGKIFKCKHVQFLLALSIINLGLLSVDATCSQNHFTLTQESL